MDRSRRRRRSWECPNCGVEFPAGRPACPECGSDPDTGWKPGEEIEYEAVVLPEGEIDYEALGLPADRVPARPRPGPLGMPRWLATLLLLALLLAFLSWLL